MGATLRTIRNSTTPSVGAQMMNTRASRGFIRKDMPTPIASMTGLRTIAR